MRRAPFLVLGFALLISGVVDAQGTTLYVNRIVTADPGDIALGDLVQAAGDVPAAARETLAQSIAVVGEKVLLIPASLYREQLESAFGRDSIIVGSRTIVVPRGMLPEEETYLLSRLADYLSLQGLTGAECTALSLMQYQIKGSFPTDGKPFFQVSRGGNGSVEVSYSLAGSGGGSVLGKASFLATAGDSGSADGVRSGTPVKVIFHKGPITIEIPGKATAAAPVGGRVGVYVADSRRNFIGRVVDGKAVEVELP
jgi:Chaperone for flagella basal body P-ring formation